MLTELDARLDTGLVLSVCVQAALAVPLLAGVARGGGPAGAAVAAARRGEAVVAVAVTDSGLAGSDVLGGSTAVRVQARNLVLAGEKDWITNAAHCDYALVLSRQGQARHFTSFSWVLVPCPAAGMTVIPAAGDNFFAGAGVAHLRFADVMLPAAHLVGTPHRALANFARQARTERLASALWARALCRRLLADTGRWLRNRPMGAQTLWENAAIRERFARCVLEWARLDAVCKAYGTACDGGPSDGAAMVLKTAAASSVDRIVGECARLRGADCFRSGGEGRLMAEVAMFGIAGGATGVMLAGLAEHADDLLATAP